MEKVLGIGGLFFRSKDTGALAKWYLDTLGIDLVPTEYEGKAWRPNGGICVFAPFDADTDYFGRPEQQWMINFRVRDLDAMMAQLRETGIDVAHEGDFPNGRFAMLKDPEGNPIQLWEPIGAALDAEERT